MDLRFESVLQSDRRLVYFSSRITQAIECEKLFRLSRPIFLHCRIFAYLRFEAFRMRRSTAMWQRYLRACACAHGQNTRACAATAAAAAAASTTTTRILADASAKSYYPTYRPRSERRTMNIVSLNARCDDCIKAVCFSSVKIEKFRHR